MQEAHCRQQLTNAWDYPKKPLILLCFCMQGFNSIIRSKDVSLGFLGETGIAGYLGDENQRTEAEQSGDKERTQCLGTSKLSVCNGNPFWKSWALNQKLGGKRRPLASRARVITYICQPGLKLDLWRAKLIQQPGHTSTNSACDRAAASACSQNNVVCRGSVNYDTY